jgi:hypothetical protein
MGVIDLDQIADYVQSRLANVHDALWAGGTELELWSEDGVHVRFGETGDAAALRQVLQTILDSLDAQESGT